jgi:hypothetical protein
MVSLFDGLFPAVDAAPEAAPEAAAPSSEPLPQAEAPPPPELVIVDPTLPPVDFTGEPDPIGEPAATSGAGALLASAAGDGGCDLASVLGHVFRKTRRCRPAWPVFPVIVAPSPTR